MENKYEKDYADIPGGQIHYRRRMSSGEPPLLAYGGIRPQKNVLPGHRIFSRKNIARNCLDFPGALCISDPAPYAYQIFLTMPAP